MNDDRFYYNSGLDGIDSLPNSVERDGRQSRRRDRCGDIARPRLGSVRDCVGEGIRSDVARRQRVVNSDASGKNRRVITVKDAANNLSTVVYDSYDKVSQVQFPMPTTGAGASNDSDYEGYGYDNNGNVTSVCRRSGETITLIVTR